MLAAQRAACVAEHARALQVVIGETGSGKTTQIPQILLDAGLAGDGGSVAVTQPRRVAAVSVARRVAFERGAVLGREVGYTVRFEDCSGAETRLKFLTDGCLLREMLTEPSLRQYAVVVLDEAHERSLSTDILFALLKALARDRSPPLKLVVTSATLDGEKFSAYFGDCPVLRVPGRAYPVTLAHAADAPPSGELMPAALDTVWDVHVRQPPGDVLLFLTGADEIERAARELNARVAAAPPDECGDMQVLPLYAALPPDVQARVFAPPPAGCRRVVIATNIAETSLTVPGVVYVVDPGLVKQKEYDPATGMESLLVRPISRVAAAQRAGRAGRTCPGRCYRLYTAHALAHDMPAETVPEIGRVSLVGAVLHLKSLALPGLDVLSFDFLDPPAVGALADALRQLHVLDAIDADGVITPLGREMAALPLDPPLARATLAARDAGCLRDMCTLSGLLSAERVFDAHNPHAPAGQQPPGAELVSRADAALGDHVVLLRVFQAWERAGASREWCRQHRVQSRGLEFARDVRRQLLAVFRGKEGAERESPGLASLRRALCLGFATRLARRMPRHNGYRTANETAVLCQLHPSCSPALVEADEGLGPDWVVYHELVATPRAFLRQVCAVDEAWVTPLLPRLRDVDVQRLSGGKFRQQAEQVAAAPEAQAKPAPAPAVKAKADAAAVDAARQRFLERKRKAEGMRS